MEVFRQDLSTVFEMNVLFDKFDYGKEQSVLFCDISEAKTNFNNKDELESLEFSGYLEYCTSETRLDCSYIQKKYEMFLQSKKKVKGCLYIDKKSSNIKYTKTGQFFTKFSVRFSYFLKQDFNISRTDIKELNIIINEK